MLLKQLVRVHARERRLTAEQLVHHATETVNISGGRQRLSPNLFWGHVAASALHCFFAKQTSLLFLERLGN